MRINRWNVALQGNNVLMKNQILTISITSFNLLHLITKDVYLEKFGEIFAGALEVVRVKDI